MKINKIIMVLILIIMVVLSLYTVSFAELDPTTSMKDMQDASSAEKAEGTTEVGKVINTIIGFIQVAGTGISLIMVSILGIKYLLAAPNDKADAKKQIMPMLIGAILLFGAANIMQIISDFVAESFQ